MQYSVQDTNYQINFRVNKDSEIINPVPIIVIYTFNEKI